MNESSEGAPTLVVRKRDILGIQSSYVLQLAEILALLISSIRPFPISYTRYIVFRDECVICVRVMKVDLVAGVAWRGGGGGRGAVEGARTQGDLQPISNVAVNIYRWCLTSLEPEPSEEARGGGRSVGLRVKRRGLDSEF